MSSAPAYTLVADAAGVDALRDRWSAARRFHLDTEFRSAKGGHTLSLIQVAVDGDPEVALIDALELRRGTAARELLAPPDAEWVVHAGRQDVDLLCGFLGVDGPPRLFDTQVAWALLGPEWGVSLAYLLFRCTGERRSKQHQVDDWIRRPLSPELLAYAAGDAADVRRLHAALEPRLRESGRQAWVAEASLEQCTPMQAPPKRLTAESFRNAWQLDQRQLAALAYVIEWHNGLDAAARDDAPGKDALLAIVQALPSSGRAMIGIRGVWAKWAKRHGDALAAGIQAAAAAAPAGAPADPPPYATFAGIQRDGWWRSARAEVSTLAGVAPEVAFPKPVAQWLQNRLAAVDEAGSARAAIADEFRGWRADALAAPWREFCAR